MNYYIGADLGTSALKLLLVAEGWNVVTMDMPINILLEALRGDV